MRCIAETIRNHAPGDIYWSKVRFFTDDGNKQTKVLFAASIEYLWQKFQRSDPKDDDLESWQNEIIRKWEAKGNQIFEKNTHHDVYGTSQTANDNLLNFVLTK